HGERISLGGRAGAADPSLQRHAGPGRDHDPKPAPAGPGCASFQEADGNRWIALLRLRPGDRNLPGETVASNERRPSFRWKVRNAGPRPLPWCWPTTAY